MKTRTTLTLDDDVAARLEQLRAKRSRSFKRLVNAALRAGLERLEEEDEEGDSRYEIKPVSLGARIPGLDNVAESLALYEGEDFR